MILRRRSYSDADRILTVFTPRLGKRVLIAKGARKTTSRKAGHLELFSHANLLVAQARTWDIVTETVTVESFLNLRTNLDGISRAAYICELVDAFTAEDDENETLWELLLLCLRELNALPESAPQHDLLLRWFELHLLFQMGFQPELFACLGCGEDLRPVLNFLHLHAGGVFCPDCGRAQQGAEPITAQTLKVLRHLVRTQWESLRELRLGHSTALAVESVLQRYLVTVLERRLKSADFIFRLRQSSGTNDGAAPNATESSADGMDNPPSPADPSYKAIL